MLWKNRVYQHGGSLRGPPILRWAKRSGGLDFSKPLLDIWACQSATVRQLFFFAVVRQLKQYCLFDFQ
jgi:hypothetical protein